MKIFERKLEPKELGEVMAKYGDYIKVTVDVENGWLVVGPELHADAVPILKEKGSIEKNIWGGWINFIDKEVETSAVWNIKSEPENRSMEILDPVIREKFIWLIKDFFEFLWK